MATATSDTSSATSCPTKDPVPYKKIKVDLKKRPGIKKELKVAQDFLNYVMCRFPDDEDPKYEDGIVAFEDDFDKIALKTNKIKPEAFDYTFYLIDEKAYDDAIFTSYKGDIYWNDFGREYILDPNQPIENFEYKNRHKVVYSSLKPLKIFAAGDKPLTPRLLCVAVAKLGYDTGDHCFLEEIKIEMREIDGKEAVTIVFMCGS